MPIKLATPLAFDKNGKPLHKFQPCKYEGEQIEIIDIIPKNQVCISTPEGDVEVVDGIELELMQESSKEPVSFSSPSISDMTDHNDGMTRLLTPNDLYIDGAADILMKLMKKISKAVRIIQFKIDKIERAKLASDGTVMQGTVSCMLQVQENCGNRKGSMNVSLAIKNGEVQLTDRFIGGDKEYPFTENAVRVWLNIPEKPYYSKKPTPVTRSTRDGY